MSIPSLKNFYLVGGTCLALRYAHRKSIDLDLFAVQDFENEKIIAAIIKDIPDFEVRTSNKVGIFGYINDLKIDLIKHHFFKRIQKSVFEDGIRMFGDRDIMAMKIFAILNRAHKKDFWDVAELLHHYTLQEFIEAYQKKYPSNQMLISIPHALCYFEDAEESEDPVSLKNQTWEGVKQIIKDKVGAYLK